MGALLPLRLLTFTREIQIVINILEAAKMVTLPYANSLQSMHAGSTDNYINTFITSNSVHKPGHQFSYFSDQSTVVGLANTLHFPYNHTESEHSNTTANSGILQY